MQEYAHAFENKVWYYTNIRTFFRSIIIVEQPMTKTESVGGYQPTINKKT